MAAVEAIAEIGRDPGREVSALVSAQARPRGYTPNGKKSDRGVLSKEARVELMKELAAEADVGAAAEPAAHVSWAIAFTISDCWKNRFGFFSRNSAGSRCFGERLICNVDDICENWKCHLRFSEFGM